MSELLGPTFIFDSGIGKTYEHIDPDRDALVSHFRACNLSDDAINNTLIEFKQGVKPDMSEDNERAECFPRRIVIWLGNYAALAQKISRNERMIPVMASVVLSEDLAHEIEHLRQFEEGEFEDITFTQLALPHNERSWEQQANQVQEEYRASLRRRESSLLCIVDFDSLDLSQAGQIS